MYDRFTFTVHREMFDWFSGSFLVYATCHLCGIQESRIIRWGEVRGGRGACSWALD